MSCLLILFFLIQILCIYDCLHEIDLEAVAKYVSGLQQPDGSFFGDKWGEVDTRFSFCAVAILTLIVSLYFMFVFSEHYLHLIILKMKFSYRFQNKMDVINATKAIEFVMSCCNPDGGFGMEYYFVIENNKR